MEEPPPNPVLKPVFKLFLQALNPEKTHKNPFETFNP